MSAEVKARLRVGTRGSPLALAQTAAVCEQLSRVHHLETGDIEVRIIKTTGDQIQYRPLAEIGGKGLFTKELEVALASREIDFAVHSTKDMTTALPTGLVISAFLEREDARDVLISREERPFKELPPGASLGTTSLRRDAQARRLRPDLKVQSLRGNVHTRLRKVGDGEIDATILGMAGLKRLGLTEAITQVLSLDEFLPAVGQGVVAIETREDDENTRTLLSAINHRPTATAVTAERAFLAEVDGSCRMPIAGYAEVSGSALHFRAMVFRPASSEVFETERTGDAADAETIGIDAGAELKSQMSVSHLAKVV